MLRMMPVLAFLLSVILYLIILTNPGLALAALVVEVVEPKPFTVGSDHVTIRVRSDQPIFNRSIDYTYIAYPLGKTLDQCPPHAISLGGKKEGLRVKPSSESELVARWSIGLATCTNEMGIWVFSLWPGTSNNYRNLHDPIVSGWRFAMEQPGGGLPSIYPLRRNLLVGTEPDVVIMDAKRGNMYTFWWHGLDVNRDGFTAWSAPGDGSYIVHINKPRGDDYLAQAVTRRVCMEAGDHRGYFLNHPTCRYTAEFNYQSLPPSTTPQCDLLPPNPSITQDALLKAYNLAPNSDHKIEIQAGSTIERSYVKLSNNRGILLESLPRLDQGNYTLMLKNNTTDQEICRKPLIIGGASSGGGCQPGDPNCTKGGGEPCDPQTGGWGDGGVMTAIGCVPTQPSVLINTALRVIAQAAGGIALLIMVFGALQMLVSAGNPETLKKGQEQFTQAVIGLLFIIFSVLLLEIIGVDILAIPGFGR